MLSNELIPTTNLLVNPSRDLIDEALANWANQTMVPQSHVVDLLLDLRKLTVG